MSVWSIVKACTERSVDYRQHRLGPTGIEQVVLLRDLMICELCPFVTFGVLGLTANHAVEVEVDSDSALADQEV